MVRVCSGRFERGMRVTNARTGKPFALPHVRYHVFGDERVVLDEAYPGDVVGAVNAGELRVGDTLYDGPAVRFAPIPTLAPEHFATARNDYLPPQAVPPRAAAARRGGRRARASPRAGT